MGVSAVLGLLTWLLHGGQNRLLDLDHGPCPAAYATEVAMLDYSSCGSSPNLVTMIWTSAPSTFSERNQWAIESVLASEPCSRVRVFTNTLPLDFFDTFADYGFSVEVVRFDLSAGSDLVGLAGSPGSAWAKGMDEWAKGQYFHVHLSDMLRLFVLYRFGGTYLDFDHIVLQSMRGLPLNTVGAEICFSDNPDCLERQQLADIGVLGRSPDDLQPVADSDNADEETASRMSFNTHNLYTPCNGVMANWTPQHPLIAAALAFADEHYDRKCWGCLGPRLFGRLLLDAHEAGDKVQLSLEPPGRFYPFDYKSVRLHMTEAVSLTEAVLDDTTGWSVLGAHFYGKVSADIKLLDRSTMGRLVRGHTIFKQTATPHLATQSDEVTWSLRGVHKWEFVVRKPSVPFCLYVTSFQAASF